MCGLIAVSGSVSSPFEVFFGLMNLQHRGQDGAGILTVDQGRKGGFQLQKGSGLVENVFSERSFKNLRGTAALGHSRYATIGRDDPNLLQPFLDYETGVGLAHNGNIVNFYALREEVFLENPAAGPVLESDSALILRILADELQGKKTEPEAVFAAIKVCMQKLVGSYSILCVTRDGDLFGFRDPHGIRPLVFGRKTTEEGEQMFAMASETVALSFLGYEELEQVPAGGAIYVEKSGKITKRVIDQRSQSSCMFEWVYFARVESEFDNVSVYDARFRLGLIAARRVQQLGIEADVVVPVPETSRSSAIAMAEALNLPFRELLIKNRYVNRTFILEGQQSRQEAIRRKLFPISNEFKGKRCLIVDDSIVRGNTAKQILKLIRQSGASHITLVSTCPKLQNPCYYGIDFPSPSELVAYNRTEEEVATELGADRVVFQTVEGLREALNNRTLCTGCVTGEYPTNVESGKAFEENRLLDREMVPKGKPGKVKSC
ncbi:MAG TPA: amidophosphoribosyltransferase [Oculatellaceae cyanobacterium]